MCLDKSQLFFCNYKKVWKNLHFISFYSRVKHSLNYRESYPSECQACLGGCPVLVLIAVSVSPSTSKELNFDL
jgi:hypothetical protein